jgi:hypothetical protein
LFLSTKSESNKSQLDAALDLSDLLLTFIPQLAKDSVDAMLAASDIPYMEASVKDENVADDSVTIDESTESQIDGQQKDNQIDEAVESDDETSVLDDCDESYLLLWGNHLSFSFTVCNCSFIFLMDGSSLNGNAMELNIQRAALEVLSCRENENFWFTLDRTSMSACRLVPSRTASCSLQIGHIPIKEALLIEHVQVQYTGTNNSNEKQTENSIRAPKKVQFARVENPSKSSQVLADTVKLRLNITLSKILVNLSPTVILVLSGFYQVSSKIILLRHRCITYFFPKMF